jgi:protoporphyrinogen oxidase
MQEQDSDNAIVIAGGGLTGLMSALKLRQLHPGRKIVVVDKSAQVGGMYASLLYMEDIRFDHGMHVIYESCNPEVDDLYRAVMPESEWNIYEGNEKDIAGLFFRGSLQTYSHYVDLRTFPSDAVKSFAGSFLQNLGACQVSNPKSAMDFLRNQFGKEVVDAVHRPILKMMYGVDPESLDLFATKATALERVTLFDATTMLDLMKSSMLRARLAFPDQLNLPPIRENTQKALYPKKFGMSNFIDRLRDHLRSKGVEILIQTDISEVRQHNGSIVGITVSNKEWGTRTLHVDRMLWTAGWPSLARQLKVDISDLNFQTGPEIIFMNLAFDRPLAMDRLYYFYCYDEGFASFRVTNYVNYCPAAAQDGHFPMCVELWPSKIGKKKAGLGQDEWVQLALDELRRFSVISPDHNLVFSRMENNVGGFPMPTLENTRSLEAIRARVAERRIGNLSVAGVMAKDNLFFIPDILNDAFSKLHAF